MNRLKKHTKVDFATYLGVIAAWGLVMLAQSQHWLGRSTMGL